MFLFYRGGCGLSPSQRYDGHRVFVVENKESELDKKTNFWQDDGKHEKMLSNQDYQYLPGYYSKIDGGSWFRSMRESKEPNMEKFVKVGNKYALIFRTEYINPGYDKKWCAPILRVQVLSTAEIKGSNFGVPTPCK